MTRAAFVRDTVAWVNQRLAPPGVRVYATTPLFRDGLIDSLKILRLIAWTEVALGRPIADEEIALENFQDIERIAATFVEETADAGE